jgi:spectinomycin phosphotransferase
MGTAVYRVVSDGTTYFLKLRRNFDEIIVRVPLLLKSQGIQEIIAPIETKSRQGWLDFGEYTMILYPFIDGRNGFEMELSDDHRRSLGAALRAIHSAQIPSELKRLIPQELFAPQWRERMEFFQAEVENKTFDEPTARKLTEFIKSRHGEITHLIQRAKQLALELQSKPLQFVLCHTDIHGGNILLCRDQQLLVPTQKIYIVDWDNPLLAPKERDLMFIGGGIDEVWKTEQEETIFYEGYGNTDVNLVALAYYRYERIIQDMVAFCEQLLLSDEGGTDRERAYRWFTNNFEPSQTIAIADSTYKLLA